MHRDLRLRPASLVLDLVLANLFDFLAGKLHPLARIPAHLLLEVLMVCSDNQVISRGMRDVVFTVNAIDSSVASARVLLLRGRIREASGDRTVVLLAVIILGAELMAVADRASNRSIAGGLELGRLAPLGLFWTNT